MNEDFLKYMVNLNNVSAEQKLDLKKKIIKNKYFYPLAINWLYFQSKENFENSEKEVLIHSSQIQNKYILSKKTICTK